MLFKSMLSLVLIASMPSESKGQDFSRYVYEDIQAIKSKKIDTIVSFGISRYGQMIDSLRGIGTVRIFEIQYLFYKEKNITYSLKYAHHCNEDCDSTLFSKSKELELSSDSIFIWVREFYDILKDEEIYPYIYEVKNNNIICYDIFTTSHALYYHIRINTHLEEINKTINPDYLKENGCAICPSNLNYQYNHKTKLYAFYVELNNLVDLIDGKFHFSTK